MAMVCEYGRLVKHGLVDKGYSLGTLAQLVSEKTGMYCDQPLLSRMISGEIKAAARPVIAEAVNEILGIRIPR